MGLVILVHSVDNVLAGPYMPGLSLCISVLACMARPRFLQAGNLQPPLAVRASG